MNWGLELGPKDQWLYGPGQIITLCGLRLSPSENRKRDSDGKKWIGGREGRREGEGGRRDAGRVGAKIKALHFNL